MGQINVGPLGRNDPFTPLDVKEECDQLNRDNSEFSRNWKRDSITKWMPRKDKAMNSFRLLESGFRHLIYVGGFLALPFLSSFGSYIHVDVAYILYSWPIFD